MILAVLLLAGIPTAGQQREPRRCEAEPGRKAERITGDVRRGNQFESSTPGGWLVRLRPLETGWGLEVTQKGREEEDLARLTPPWHFVPNARDIEGWHFRNKDNTGPNDGSVNAPREIRDFIFSPEVGRGIEYNGSGTTPQDVARVEAFGRGWLRLEQFELSPPRRGERATMESLRFTVCLTMPASANSVPQER